MSSVHLVYDLVDVQHMIQEKHASRTRNRMLMPSELRDTEDLQEVKTLTSQVTREPQISCPFEVT